MKLNRSAMMMKSADAATVPVASPVAKYISPANAASAAHVTATKTINKD